MTGPLKPSVRTRRKSARCKTCGLSIAGDGSRRSLAEVQAWAETHADAGHHVVVSIARESVYNRPELER